MPRLPRFPHRRRRSVGGRPGPLRRPFPGTVRPSRGGNGPAEPRRLAGSSSPSRWGSKHPASRLSRGAKGDADGDRRGTVSRWRSEIAQLTQGRASPVVLFHDGERVRAPEHGFSSRPSSFMIVGTKDLVPTRDDQAEGSLWVSTRVSPDGSKLYLIQHTSTQDHPALQSCAGVRPEEAQAPSRARVADKGPAELG